MQASRECVACLQAECLCLIVNRTPLFFEINYLNVLAASFMNNRYIDYGDEGWKKETKKVLDGVRL